MITQIEVGRLPRCPFCGEKAVAGKRLLWISEPYVYSVGCETDACNGNISNFFYWCSIDSAIKYWSKRVV